MKSNLFRRGKTAFAVFTVASMIFSLVSFAPQADAAITQVSRNVDGVTVATNPATGFPLWYKDAAGVALQLCLGTGADGVGAVDPKCILPGQVSPIDPITAVGTNFPGESFYWFAEAPLTINGQSGRFRMAVEAAFASDPVAVNGQQITFARASLFTSQDGVFPPNSSFHVVYPFGAFDFSTDAVGAMVASNPNPLIAPFQPNGGGAKEMRAEDGPGAANDFTTILTGTNTGITTFLRSATLNIPQYLGDGVSETPVIGGTNGNVVTITQTAGVGPFTVVGGTNWIISGKVADTVPPVITITGGAATTVTAGTAYVEQGATAFDAFDNATTTATVSASTVPVGNLSLLTGPFSVTYTATDNAGNIATATRTVTVVPDTTPPAVTLVGPAVINLKVGTPYVEQGATVVDNVDGPMANATASGTVDVAVAGTYTVTYTSAADSSGLIGTNTRTVNVAADVTAPVITITGPATVNVSQGDVYTDAGATALDDFDGDRTANIITTGLPISTLATGTFSVVYTVADITGNTSTATRTVNVILDATAPVITVTGANPASVLVGAVYTDAGATAIDNIDGVIATTSIITTGLPINTAATGTFNVVYTATDAAGNVGTATRVVNVVTDAVAPVISIIGNNPTNINVGTAYTDAGATALDDVDGNVTVTSTSTVDTAVAGTYTVTYTATDAAGNVASASRTVVVSVVQRGGGGGRSFIPTQVTPVVVTPVIPNQVINQPNQQVLGAKIYRDGSLVKGPNDRIYYIVSGQKFHIRNLNELQVFVGRPNVRAAQGDLDQYPDFSLVKQSKIYKDGMMLRDKDSNKIFLVRNQKLVYIPNLIELAKLGKRTTVKVDVMTLMQYSRF